MWSYVESFLLHVVLLTDIVNLHKHLVRLLIQDLMDLFHFSAFLIYCYNLHKLLMHFSSLNTSQCEKTDEPHIRFTWFIAITFTKLEVSCHYHVRSLIWFNVSISSACRLLTMSMLLLLDSHMELIIDSFHGGYFITHMEVGFHYPRTIRKQVPLVIRSL